MAKTKKKAKTEQKAKKLTCITFLRELYKKDKNVSNERALQLLLGKFPMSKATPKALCTWKNMLRVEGLSIPKRTAAKKKVAKKKKKKVT